MGNSAEDMYPYRTFDVKIPANREKLIELLMSKVEMMSFMDMKFLITDAAGTLLAVAAEPKKDNDGDYLFWTEKYKIIEATKNNQGIRLTWDNQPLASQVIIKVHPKAVLTNAAALGLLTWIYTETLWSRWWDFRSLKELVMEGGKR